MLCDISFIPDYVEVQKNDKYQLFERLENKHLTRIFKNNYPIAYFLNLPEFRDTANR